MTGAGSSDRPHMKTMGGRANPQHALRLRRAASATYFFRLSAILLYIVCGDPDTNWPKQPSGCDVDTGDLVASWVLDCRVLWNPKESDPEHANLMEIALNARTGKMPGYFDTRLKGGGDVRYKGFIS